MEPEKGPSSSSQNSPAPRGPLYILLSVFAFVFGWSLLKSRIPIQNSSQTIHPQDTPRPESQSSHEKSRGPLVIDSPTNYRHPQNGGRHKAPWWERVIGIGLLLVNVGLWWATRRSVDNAKDSGQRQLRAYVLYSEGKIANVGNGVYAVLINARNSGQTPAYATQNWWTYKIMPDPTGEIIAGKTRHILDKDFYIMPTGALSEDIAGQGGLYVLLPPADGNVTGYLTEEQVANLQAGKPLFVWGIVGYHDAFQRCQYSAFVAKSGEGNAKDGWNLLPYHQSSSASAPCGKYGENFTWYPEAGTSQ